MMKKNKQTKVNIVAWSLFKRSLSLLLALTVMVQGGVFAPFNAKAATSANVSGRLNLGEGIIEYQQTLTDNGDGTYSLTLSLADASSVKDASEDETVSKNGYFTAPADGKYLVELWGGSGASGNASSYGVGGTGGAGGFVYGIVTLKKGETLFYQLGGNGQQTTAEDSGGGVNGSGGHAGASTTYVVGGGGGYSAVYLFAAGEFESKYLDNKGNMLADFISEADRISKFIMVAGGGGGGGAGSGNTLFRDAGNAPNGGIGGTVGISASGTLPDGGTFFAGGNGMTSGTSTAYTGEGATDVPGDTMESILGTIGLDWFVGLQPNDWVASYNAENSGGSGGAGNLRGGSGGAGYAGGSGGVQTEIIIPTNVGGGGGGSSYVAAIVDYKSVTANYEDHDYSSGGAVGITAISDDSSLLFKDMSLALTPSAYFQLGIDSELSPIEKDGEIVGYQTAEGWIIEGNSAGGYTLSGLDLSSESQNLTLTFTPKTGFAGGNAVPLLTGNALTVSDASQANPEQGIDTPTATLNLDADCAKVNVPLDFQAIGMAHISNISGKEYALSELYEDNYADIRNNLSADPNYDFIQSVGEYQVKQTATDTILNGPVAPVNSTFYTVYFEVVPKAVAPAAVGTPVTITQFSSEASIIIIVPNQKDLNGNSVTFNKDLTYENGQYVLSFQADISPKPITPATYNMQYIYKATSDDSQAQQGILYGSSGSYMVQASGYYFIQAWGGSGGKGGDAKIGSNKSQGGDGGSGGYIEGFVYLNAGDVLSIEIGKNGQSYGLTEKSGVLGNVWVDAVGTPGDAGGNTSIKIGEDYYLVAGGGGGGGAAWRSSYVWNADGSSAYAGQSGYNSEIDITSQRGSMSEVDTAVKNGSVRETTTWYDKLINTSYSAAVGGTGNTSGVNTGGSAGSTIRNSSINTTNADCTPSFNVDTIGQDYTNTQYTNQTGGAVYITCLQIDYEATATQSMANYQLISKFDQYFQLDRIEGYNLDADGNDAAALVMNLPQIPEVDAPYEIGISGINPSIDDNGEAHFEIRFYFDPRSGFVGGNDVPLLFYDKSQSAKDSGMENGMKLQQKNANGEDNWIVISIAGQEATDYANVALNTSSIGSITVGSAAGRTIDLEKSPIEGIAPSAMFTWTNEPNLDADDWRFDFVTTFESLTKKGGTDELINSSGIVPNPLVSTLYTATVGIRPKVETAHKAVVINSVASVSKTQDVEIIVIPRIKYELTNMETSDKADLVNINGNLYYTINTPDKDYYAKLSPAQGYQLPNPFVPGENDKIAVFANDGTEITAQVQYEPITGTITIPAGLLIGTVTIRAEGIAKKYSITFYRQNTLDGKPEKIDGGSYASGEDLSGLEVPSEPASIDGYDFVWDWSDWDPSNPATNDGQPTVMPNQSIVVIGTFVPKEQTVTVHYVDNYGTPIASDKVIESYYMADVTEIAPAIDGYILTGEDTKTLTGITEDAEITFTYVKATGSMYIVYQYADGTQVNLDSPDQNPYTAPISAGDSYSVKSPDITGYSPYILGPDNTKTEAGTVSGTIQQSDVDNGKVIYVTYLPNTFTVTFHANGGTVAPDTMLVEYDNVYNYDAASKTMVGLPTPVWPGRTFSCWYQDINGNGTYDPGEEVEGTDIVTGDVTLIAHWTVNKGRVVLILVDENGNSVYYTYVNDSGKEVRSSTKVYEGDIDTLCQFTAPDVTDYVAVSNATGTRTYASSTQLVYVTYRYTVHMLTIQYLFQDGTTAAESHISIFREGDTQYVVTSPVYSPELYPQLKDHKPSMASYTNSCTSITDITVTVYYIPEDQTTVVSVTVTWGNLIFDYDYGIWNTATHQYDNPSIQPQINDENTVTVTSNQETNIPVHVTLSYSSNDDYDDLTGYYTEANNRYGSHIAEYTLLPQQYKKCYFWLDGFLPPGQTGQPQVGSCTVTISAEEP